MAETEDPTAEDWRQIGRTGYDDAQPLHAAPSAEPYKTWWLEGWHERHAAAENEATRNVIAGTAVCLNKIAGKIYLCALDGTPIGEQAYIELEADKESLDWTARVTFTGLRLDDD